MCNVLQCITCTHVFGPNCQEKNLTLIFSFNSFVYFYLETKLIIVFQAIILHMDIVIAF